MAESRERLKSTESDRRLVEELIVDYALKDCMQDVITAFATRRGYTCYNNMKVPHLRIAAFTVYTIVQKEDVGNYDRALQLLDTVHSIAPDLIPIKNYIKLITGLKTKVLLDKLLQPKLDYADVCASMNRYFPKAELKTRGVSPLESKSNSYQLSFRRRITRLMLMNGSEREVQSNQMDLGDGLTDSIQHLITMYIDGLNEQISKPVMEQIMAKGPQAQIALEMQDSQSDVTDQLIATSLYGPPSQDALLSLLRSCWEAEDGETQDMEKSDNDAKDLDSSSSSDIFKCSAKSDRRTSSTSTKRRCPKEAFTSKYMKTVNDVTQRGGLNDYPAQDKMQDIQAPSSTGCLQQSTHEHDRRDNLSPSHMPVALDAVEDSSSYMKMINEVTSTYTRVSGPNSCDLQNSAVQDEEESALVTCSESNPAAEIIAKQPEEIQPGSPVIPLLQWSDSHLDRAFHQGNLNSTPSDVKRTLSPGFTSFIDTQDISRVSSSNNNVSMYKMAPMIGSVSKSRIYLSKNHPQMKPQKKKSPTKRKSKLGHRPSMTSSCNEHISQIVKSYKMNKCDVVYINVDLLSSDLSSLQDTLSSEGSHQSSSDKSSTSLSILTGHPALNCTPNYPQSITLEMMSLKEEMKYLTRFNEHPAIPDLQIYPVTSLLHCDPLRDAVESTASNIAHEVIPETAASEQPDGHSVLHPAEQDITVSSNSNSNSNYRAADDNNDNMDVEDCRDAKDKHLVVMLRRLSQDSEAKKYLTCQELSADNVKDAILDNSSDSEDSFVADSDDGTGSWSDSSSLPSIELRPDSEIPFVRRIPTLKRYLHNSPEKDIPDNPPYIKMRDCSVRLCKLQPKDIIALNNIK